MLIRLLSLAALLGVLGGMMSAEWPTNETATVQDAGPRRNLVEDPYPPPTPRP